MSAVADHERQLRKDIAACWDDPLRYVMMAFPWGEPGTPLADYPDGPDDWQREQLDGIRDHILTGKSVAYRGATASGHGIGKLLGYHAVLDTPKGKTRWGDLQPGDFVFGADGKPTRIIQTTHYVDVPMYRVTFDDGSHCDVSSGHLWTVRGRQERRNNLDTWRTLETIDILDKGVKRKNGKAQARQWEVPVQGMAEFEPAEQPLHPYFMGLWLSDGGRKTPRFTKTSDAVVNRLAVVSGYDITTCAASPKTRRVLGITKAIDDEPVFQCYSFEKYIPDNYKYASVDQRIELFRGLCDGDGEVHSSGSIGYSTTSKALAEDVLWLARSLGCKATMQPAVKTPWYTGPDGKKRQGRDCYRVTLNCPFNPFTHEDRRSRYKPSQARYLSRWIDSIEYIGQDDGMCITVEAEDGLYQANDFIVTHNSAITSWIILWFMSTRPSCAGVVTANTKQQLDTKTWRELSLWHKRAINAHWFKWTATKFYALESPETWYISAIPWSESNPEAFAGLHADDVLVIYDEASAIHDSIWDVTEGAMTTAGAMWLAFGNPTRNTGKFRECFRKMRHRWVARQVDSRYCRMTNKAEIDQWAEDYGGDSDFFRIRVKGQFPRAASSQLIGEDLAENARLRLIPKRVYERYPVILGVDVARFGDDRSVIYRRQGPQLFSPRVFREKNTMEIAALAYEEFNEHNADVVAVDGIGVGAGVVDRLEELGVPVVDVQSAAAAEDPRRYYNARAELAWRLKEWLEWGSIPDDRELIEELTAVEYGYNIKMQLQLEKTEDIKERLGMSPDKFAALCMTMTDPSRVARMMSSEERAVARPVKPARPMGAWT